MPDVIVEETGPSTDNDGRTTAVFADPELRGSSSDNTNNSCLIGNENSNAMANNNFQTHLQTESVLSSQALERSERFMSKDSYAQFPSERFMSKDSAGPEVRSEPGKSPTGASSEP